MRDNPPGASLQLGPIADLHLGGDDGHFVDPVVVGASSAVPGTARIGAPKIAAMRLNPWWWLGFAQCEVGNISVSPICCLCDSVS